MTVFKHKLSKSKQKCRAIFLVSALLVLVFPHAIGTVAALSPDQKQLLDTGVYYFDIKESAACSASSSTTTTSSSKPSDVYMLGDSITVRASSAYQAAFQQAGITADIDGSSSRSLNGPGISGNKLTGMQAITHDKAQIAKAQAIIVALGTNGGDTNSSIDAAIAALRADNSSASIYWVDTISTNRPGYQGVIASNNQAIYSQASSQNYKVISWFKTVDSSGDPQHPKASEPDPHSYIDTSDGLNVHPTQAGISALTSLVVGAVAGGSNSASQGGSCCNGATTPLNGSDNPQKVFNYFVGKGLSAAAAAGIAGNAMLESGAKINPTDSQSQHGSVPANEMVARGLLGKMSGGNGWGAFQWDPPGNVITPLLKAGKNPDDLGTQLDFLWAALQSNPSYYKLPELKAATTPEQAADIFEEGFERAGSPVLSQREKFARQVFDTYGSSGGSSTGSSDTSATDTSGDSCSSGAADAFDQTVLAYAWPDYKGQGFVQKMPAYAARISSDKQNGIYIGYDGIDCGAFVTNLILGSGFDPTYNHSGKVSEGAGNTTAELAWAKANWQDLGPATSIDTATLKPGDVAISDGHTYVWVGDIPGFHAKIASASGAGAGDPTNRAPMADTHQSPTMPGFEWFRKK